MNSKKILLPLFYSIALSVSAQENLKQRQDILLLSPKKGHIYIGKIDQIQLLNGINKGDNWIQYFKEQTKINGIREYLKLLN